MTAGITTCHARDVSTRVTWWDPGSGRLVEQRFDGPVPLADHVGHVRQLWHGRAHGNPSLEFVRQDQSCLSLATDGARAFLVWTNTLYESFQSVGSSGHGATLVYDYGGSLSEAAPSDLVPLGDAIECVTAFLRTGAPDTPSVLFTPS